MADRIKIADVAKVLADMREKGVIGKYAIGGASAVALYGADCHQRPRHFFSFRAAADRHRFIPRTYF